MDVSRVANIGAETNFSLKTLVGWITGWYNPYERFNDFVTNPVDIGRLVTIQGDFMVNQGKLVTELGHKLSEFSKSTTSAK